MQLHVMGTLDADGKSPIGGLLSTPGPPLSSLRIPLGLWTKLTAFSQTPACQLGLWAFA